MWASGWTSATRRWNGFVPRSIAATRTIRQRNHCARRRYGWPVPTGEPVATSFRAMGTDVTVLALRPRDDVGARAAAALERLEAMWSRFRPTSELCAVNSAAPAPVAVSAETYALIDHAVDAWRWTAGAYDATVL